MTVSGEPGTARTLWALWRLSWRRFRHSLGRLGQQRPQAATRGRRSGTPRRGRAVRRLAVLIVPLILLQAGGLAFVFLHNLAAWRPERIELTTVLPLSAPVHAQMRELEEQRGGMTAPELEAAHAALRRAVQDSFDAHGHEQRNTIETELVMRHFAARGSDGFRPVDPYSAPQDEPSLGRMMHDPGARSFLMSGVGIMLALFGAAFVMLPMGTVARDISKVEWSLEWFFTLPIRANVLFLARIFEAAWLNPFGWIACFPPLTVLYWSRGFGVASLALAAAASAASFVPIGAARVVTETWLRKHLAPSAIRNTQAVLTVLGTVLWFCALAFALSPELTEWLADYAANLAPALLWNPFSLPVLLVDTGDTALWAGIVLVVFAAAAAIGAAWFCARLTRDGLTPMRGAGHSGTRRARHDPGHAVPGAALPALAGTGIVRGVIRKELLLLLRDRTFLVQTLVVPILILAFQMLVNPALWRHISSDFQNASTLAYGVGAYVLAFSAARVLTSEGQALWILHTVPRDLTSILVRKAALWFGFALVYAFAILGWAFVEHGAPTLRDLGLVVATTAALCVCAFLAAGMGILGSEPLAQSSHARMRPTMGISYLLVVSCLGYAMRASSVWTLIVLLVLATIMTAALWERARERIPLLLDPTAMPAPRLLLADGLVAIFAFFVLQVFVFVVGSAGGAGSEFELMVIAFAIAGAVTAFGSWWILGDRLGPHRLRELVGMGRPGSAGALLLGVATGVLCAGVGFGYLQFVPRPVDLAELRDAITANRTWLLLLGVVLAPVFEEFLFRGLVFRGLRQSLPTWAAALSSAALFAVVHPPLAAPPVFVLGFACALVFERTGTLLAPIAVHAVYNALVILTQAH